MKLYPKIIPAIARDVIASLMAEGDIEVETMRVADAEMDMAAISRNTSLPRKRVNQATARLSSVADMTIRASTRSSARWRTCAASRWATKESTTSSTR